MSHVMLTEYQLANFHNLMKAHRGFPLSDLGPQGAFDSTPKSMSSRAKDEGGEGTARRLANLLLTLKESLGEENFRGLCDRLCDEDEAEDEGEPTSGDPASQFDTPMQREMNQKAQDRRKTAKDAPPPFEGMPETKAMDSAGDPRFDYLRDAMRVKAAQPAVAYGDISSQAARSGAVSKSFSDMYPAAAKVRVS